ncbi:PaaI family thioesterase [Sinimarinibacterium sp. CAU 1509]|uniref:PaaI family thioesterase n=1 Tax=Sinimarinibacterium sp. CAU 1509 TaxID=2562283 RepID=UPI0010ACCE64|nr:PaaI family thioesterase [Sinimarinibacterium sp. CAU 1509]TJY62157.1 PaaI family thioesterase [Sinimarinibacterium sp. CAU 1509]
MSTALLLARQRARNDGEFSALVDCIPYSRYLGVELSLHDGAPLSRLPFRPDLIGNRALPAIHGGVTAAFMENAALLHLLLTGDEERVPRSIDFSIDYLLPGRDTECYARCEVTREGLRVAHCMVRCWQRSPEQPIALARAHFLLSASE